MLPHFISVWRSFIFTNAQTPSTVLYCDRSSERTLEKRSILPTKTTPKPYSWPFSSRRRLGDEVKSFPLFAVFDVALLSVFLEELVNGCHKEKSKCVSSCWGYLPVTIILAQSLAFETFSKLLMLWVIAHIGRNMAYVVLFSRDSRTHAWSHGFLSWSCNLMEKEWFFFLSFFVLRQFFFFKFQIKRKKIINVVWLF